MEEEKDSAKQYISKIVNPIFEKAIQQKNAISPQEGHTNPMRGSGGVTSKVVQPHNCRLYFSFTKEQYYPTKPYSNKNHNSEHHYTYPTHNIIIRSKTAEVVYLAHKKQWRHIIASSEEGVRQRMRELEEEIEPLCIGYLHDFVAQNGGKTDFKVIKRRKQEWGMHGDAFLDSLPNDLIIRDTVFKKVYPHKVEFTDANTVKNYINNRALEEFSPKIVEELKGIKEGMALMSDNMVLYGKSQEAFAKNIESHLALINEFRLEVQQMKKPFFIRWFEYFFK